MDMADALVKLGCPGAFRTPEYEVAMRAFATVSMTLRATGKRF